MPQLTPHHRTFLFQNVKHFYLSRHLNNVFYDAFTLPKPLSDYNIPTLSVSMSQVRRTHAALMAAKAPIILIGSQAIKAGPPKRPGSTSTNTATAIPYVLQLRAALERIGCPVFLSGMARGLFGKSHPLQLRHNRSKILKKSDFVLLIGVPADFRLDYGRHIPMSAKFYTVNLCAMTLAKNNDVRSPDMKIHADPFQMLLRLSELSPIPPAASSPKPTILGTPEWSEFLESQQSSREQEIDRMASNEAAGLAAEEERLNPLRLCRILDEIIPDTSIIVADGGDFVGTASYTIKPRQPLSWLDPGVFVRHTHTHTHSRARGTDGTCAFDMLQC